MTVLILLCIRELPDPGSYTVLGVGSEFGWFIGRLVGRVRSLPPERVAELQSDGTFWGFGAALTLWCIAVAIR